MVEGIETRDSLTYEDEDCIDHALKKAGYVFVKPLDGRAWISVNYVLQKDGQRIAAKIFQTSRYGRPLPEGLEHVKREQETRNLVDHPHVVSIGEPVLLSHPDRITGLKSEFTMITMEYLEGPSMQSFQNKHPIALQQILRAQKDPPRLATLDNLSDGERFRLMEAIHDDKSLKRDRNTTMSDYIIGLTAHTYSQVFKGLVAIHEKDAIHHDIKPANIVLDGKGAAKIVDLGVLVKGESTGHENIEGTPTYVSPEAWRGEFRQASDVYAAGISIFLHCFADSIPAFATEALNKRFMSEFPKIYHAELAASIVDYVRSRPVADEVKEAIAVMLEQDYRQRATAKQMVEVMERVKAKTAPHINDAYVRDNANLVMEA